MIEALNRITKSVGESLPELRELTENPEVMALTLLSHIQFNGTRKEVVNLLTVIINELTDKENE